MDIIGTFRLIIAQQDITVGAKDVSFSQQSLSMPVATIKALSETLQHSQASTVSGFIEDLGKLKIQLLEYTNQAVSILAGCELFGRYVTLAASDELDFEEFKVKLFERVEGFPRTAIECRRAAARHGLQFIQDGSSILVHSFSKVVMELLYVAAAIHHKRFTVFATEARPSHNAEKVRSFLQDLKIPCHIILDTAVGYFMQKMDLVLFGAEGVVENGGIINQIGTYQISILAKAANKPVYVLAETYKFVRLFPLHQYDLPSSTSSSFELVESSLVPSHTCSSNMTSHLDPKMIASPLNPMVDYTPPSYITLLFTDLGVLTPSGVSDELIKFYY